LLVYWEKSGRYIDISYRNEDGEIVSKKVKLIDIGKNNELIVRDEHDNEFSINYNDVMIDWTKVNYK